MEKDFGNCIKPKKQCICHSIHFDPAILMEKKSCFAMNVVYFTFNSTFQHTNGTNRSRMLLGKISYLFKFQFSPKKKKKKTC